MHSKYVEQQALCWINVALNILTDFLQPTSTKNPLGLSNKDRVYPTRTTIFSIVLPFIHFLLTEYLRQAGFYKEYKDTKVVWRATLS